MAFGYEDEWDRPDTGDSGEAGQPAPATLLGLTGEEVDAIASQPGSKWGEMLAEARAWKADREAAAAREEAARSVEERIEAGIELDLDDPATQDALVAMEAAKAARDQASYERLIGEFYRQRYGDGPGAERAREAVAVATDPNNSWWFQRAASWEDTDAYRAKTLREIELAREQDVARRLTRPSILDDAMEAEAEIGAFLASRAAQR